jgi:hypothetical protein
VSQGGQMSLCKNRPKIWPNPCFVKFTTITYGERSQKCWALSIIKKMPEEYKSGHMKVNSTGTDTLCSSLESIFKIRNFFAFKKGDQMRLLKNRP